MTDNPRFNELQETEKMFKTKFANLNDYSVNKIICQIIKLSKSRYFDNSELITKHCFYQLYF